MTIGAAQSSEVVEFDSYFRLSAEGMTVTASQMYTVARGNPGTTITRFVGSDTRRAYVGVFDLSGVLQRTMTIRHLNKGDVGSIDPQDMSIYGDRMYILYEDLNPDNDSGTNDDRQYFVDVYNLSGRRLTSKLIKLDTSGFASPINISGLAVTKTKIFLVNNPLVRIGSVYRGRPEIKVYSHSGTELSGGFKVPELNSRGESFLTASESRLFLIPKMGDSSPDVYVYDHAGNYRPSEGISVNGLRTSGSTVNGIDVTRDRFYYLGQYDRSRSSHLAPYLYTPTSDSDFPDEVITRRDFAPGDDVIFKITSTPAPAEPVEVMYTITSDGGIISSAEEGPKMITISAAETTITIPTLTSGVEQGYFIRITLRAGNNYQLGLPAAITDQVGEEIIS